MCFMGHRIYLENCDILSGGGVRAKRGTKHDSTGVWLRGLGE